MQKKAWVIQKQDDDEVKKVMQEYNLSELVARLVLNRVRNTEEINNYISSDISKLYDPFLMKDMDKATERILEAIKNNEKIMIYGDYDVDGVTSTVCIYSFLNDISENKGNISYYLPHRVDEGYGLNKDAMQNIKHQGYSLIITVDCGVSATEEVDFANSLGGIDIIITDHHECSSNIPKAYAVVNPKQKDCNYPFKQLAGVGVAFKTIAGLAKKLNLDEGSYLKYLDLVALGTIADIVPLNDENRIIAKEGVKVINNTKNIGLKKLLEVSGYSNEVDSIALSYIIAPRINACGRMNRADEAVELLLEKDEKKALDIAERLNTLNKKRQEVEKEILNEAIKAIEVNHLDEKEVIILGKEGWHNGVIGIVASKLTDMYYKPTILFSFDKDIGKGSGRSINGISLYNTLDKMSDKLLQFGGHELAAGLSITKANYFKFKAEMEEYIASIADQKQPPEILIDEVVTSNELTLATIKELELLKPYGQDNSAPIFIIKNVRVDGIRVLGDNKHLKLTIKDNNMLIDAIGFGLGSRRDEIVIGDKIDIVFTLEINSFNGINRVQLNIKDLGKSI